MPVKLEFIAMTHATVTSYRNKNSKLLCFTAVYFSLKDDIIPNHGYVVISDIGDYDDTALICHTNRPANYTIDRPHSGGDWFAPDETRVNVNDVPGFRRNRGPMMVRLMRYMYTDPPSEGIYYCVVEDDTDTEHTIHVGLYNSGGGIINKHWKYIMHNYIVT